jgi:cellulose synthase/poly-beta-1,6-N-acetylglucosamine synthase-like glycosyltransferase/peptidoglycan/xylan/chitin deacetylase (PgdA/CDA1 family)
VLTTHDTALSTDAGRPPDRIDPTEQLTRRPRPRWLLIVVVFTMFCCVLLTNGLVTSEIGIDAEGATIDGPDNAVPLAVSGGGPVIDVTHGRARTYAMPPKTVALTFDDGPDPTWTPQVLAELAKYHVPGTFFVIGSGVARHPELIRQIRAGGSEVGVHTFTHPDLRTVSPGRVDREIAETQIALAGAIGELSYLVRPPYSSESSAVDNAGFEVITRLGRQGYLTALVDVDSNDWQRPGVARIVHDAVPPFGQGGVVLLHDAGGNRSQTVQALDQLIPAMQAKGYRFTTLTAGMHLPPADVPADPSDLALGRVMLLAVKIATWLVAALEWSLLIVGGLVILRLIIMVWVAVGHGRRCRSPGFSWGPESARPGPVTVVVPAHNEKECIEQTVRSLAASTHPVEIIVVDDGSTDGTADIVESLRLACVRVVRQPNGGKSTALNTGIALATHDVVVMMDGDTVFEPSTIAELVAPFADGSVGAVAGNARVGDRGRLISKWQHIEYVIGFNIDRRAQDRWHAITTVPGAVGAFRASALRAAGGVSSDTLAEDTDLTIAIGRAGWRVVYQPTARAWTEAPATFGQLWRQRYRWSYGILQSLWKHRGALSLGDTTDRRLALLGLGTTALFQIVLPLLAPMVDVYLVYGMIFLAPVRTAVIWASVMVIQLVSGVIAFRLEGEKLRGLWLLPLQQLVYRQLMYAVLIQSISTALAGSRLGWQKAPRIGQFSAAPPIQHP